MPATRLMSALAFSLVLAVLTLPAVPAESAAAPLGVAVSIAPQAEVVRRVGGDRVAVTVMVPAGADAHTYEPKPSQLAALGKAGLYLAIGMDFEEAWLPRFQKAAPGLRVVRVDADIEKMPMADHDHDEAGRAPAKTGKVSDKTPHEAKVAAGPAKAGGHDHDPGHNHDHGHDHDHDHAGLPDPHIWLSPRLVLLQARATRDALIAADPEGKAVYRAGYDALAKDIADLDAELAALFAAIPAGRKSFLVFHPSWGYFARDYGLTQIPVERMGKEPGPKELARIIETGRKEGVVAIFVQPQFSRKSAQEIARALSANVLTIDPLAEDWAANLRSAGRALAGSMSGGAGQ